MADKDTAEIINHAIDKASDGLAQITHTLSTAAPQAWALAVRGVYASGISHLIIGGFCFMIFLIAMSTFLYSIKKLTAHGSEIWTVGVVIGAILSFGFGLAACVNCLDPNVWIQVLAPDAYLAQSILTKALN